LGEDERETRQVVPVLALEKPGTVAYNSKGQLIAHHTAGPRMDGCGMGFSVKEMLSKSNIGRGMYKNADGGDA